MTASALSDGELLLYTYHGRCGHRRQAELPCATPGCKEGTEYDTWIRVSRPRGKCLTAYARDHVGFGDEVHYIWRPM